MSATLQMVRAHILPAADCAGKLNKFRPTTNKEEIAQEKFLLIILSYSFFLLLSFGI